MKILIIGYGSIGKRHESVFLDMNINVDIHIVTRQNLPQKNTYRTLEEIKNPNIYDYFIISSETSKHYEQLLFLDTRVSNKIIFCEKPLIDRKKILNLKNNIFYIGYVLRFHPLLEKLSVLIQGKKMLTANIYCGQYLPTWRPDTDYTKSYSADISKGGGVLLDLSHEIDYAQWLCGKITEVKSYQKKISDLDIKSDDMTCLIGKTDKGVYINLTIDYISKITQRRLLLHTIDKSFDLDLINNILIEANKNGIEKRYTSPTLERNHMFSAMHNSILDGKTSCCTLAQALDVMETIFMIQEENNE